MNGELFVCSNANKPLFAVGNNGFVAINTNNRVESFRTNLELEWQVLEGRVTNKNSIIELHPKSLALFVKECSCK